MYGFVRVAAAVPKVRVANVSFNVKQMLDLWKVAADQNASVLLFPELSLSGYSCSDLFYQERLHRAVERGLFEMVEASTASSTAAIVGMPLWWRGRLYNCAAVVQQGKILGVVPKSYVPEHKEYYEKRWFSSGIDIKGERVELLGCEVEFGVDLLFEGDGFTFGVEVCEDLWTIVPPSSFQALAGATILFNLSASDEIVAKSEYRSSLVSTQSARCMAAYVYASCGVGESTTDVVFGGDSLIAENGTILERGERFLDESQIIFADIDTQRLSTLRVAEGSFADGRVEPFRRVKLFDTPKISQLNRYVDPHPFVPSKRSERSKRCKEIFDIQAAALNKRLGHIGAKKSVIGISGGLDSTLALLAVYRAYESSKKEPQNIVCVTMPGFGTSGRTFNNAKKLCEALGVDFREIEIKDACMEHFRQIGHDPDIHDIVYENVQARERTQILMDIANKEGGIVIGTGDMSEAALGWSTYNGDHMSMYAINIGIPKTLVRYLVEWAAQEYPKIAPVLKDILSTPVSPELLPPSEDEISQRTEELLGPYELHDFFLYHMIKSGARPVKILFLARNAFKTKYSEEEIKKWLTLFLKRFFSQQFKRSCMPDGPKVGTIALSPRGDWRMPSDAEVEEWLKDLEEGN